MSSAPDGVITRIANRILFRSLFVYLLLYLFPYPYIPALMPGASHVRPYYTAKSAVVRAAGERILHVRVRGPQNNGSSDSTYAYVEVFCCSILAMAAALAWTLVDGGRSNDERLSRGLRVYVRICLACLMISYGSLKVIKAQFPDPPLQRLVEPFGDSSPMGLLWTFMGASAAYNVFTGASELIGGLLLTARRTTLLGGLICAIVLSNVVMLNFSYDVPVKLTSLHTLGMSLFLIAPDLRRLANLFVFNRATEPVALGPPLGQAWAGYALVAARTLFVASFAWLVFGRAHRVWQENDGASRQPLYGIWTVDEFDFDDRGRRVVVTSGDRWLRVIVDRGFTVQLASDSFQRFGLEFDSEAHRIFLSRSDGAGRAADLSYEQLNAYALSLEGMLDQRNIRVQLHRVDPGAFPLLSRGFHWISEYPFNR